MQICAPPHSLASFDTALSPHRRITAPSLCAAFAHIHGEAGTSALGIWSARVGQNGPVLCAGGGVDSFACQTPPHSRFIQHTALSPHRRITAPSLCAAFAHIHGEAGTPALGIWSARVGQNGPVLCVQRRGGFLMQQNTPILAPFGTTLSPHRRITAPSLCAAFAHIHGEAGTPALGIWSARVGLNGPVSVYRRGGFLRMQTHPILASFDTTLSPHRRITAPSLCAAFAHISWRGGNTSFGHLECQGGSERSGSLCAAEGVHFFHAKHPHSRFIRHYPVSAQANHCT
jgi:hypothetical protein